MQWRSHSPPLERRPSRRAHSNAYFVICEFCFYEQCFNSRRCSPTYVPLDWHGVAHSGCMFLLLRAYTVRGLLGSAKCNKATHRHMHTCAHTRTPSSCTCGGYPKFHTPTLLPGAAKQTCMLVCIRQREAEGRVTCICTRLPAHWFEGTMTHGCVLHAACE